DALTASLCSSARTRSTHRARSGRSSARRRRASRSAASGPIATIGRGWPVSRPTPGATPISLASSTRSEAGMNKALIVGIAHYDMIGSLHGAVNGAYAVTNALGLHADGPLNFAQPRRLAGTGPDARVTRSELRAAVVELFRDDSEIALLYFAGHGYIDGAGGFLCASDC